MEAGCGGAGIGGPVGGCDVDGAGANVTLGDGAGANVTLGDGAG